MKNPISISGYLLIHRFQEKKWLSIQEKLEQIPTLLKIDLVDFNSVDEEFKKVALKYTKEI